jgi:hypothetical protein
MKGKVSTNYKPELASTNRLAFGIVRLRTPKIWS